MAAPQQTYSMITMASAGKVFPDASVLFAQQGERMLSVADLHATIHRIQQRLPASAARIAIFCEDCANFTALLWAALLAGRQPIILPNRQPGFLAAMATEYDLLLQDADVAWTDVAWLASSESAHAVSVTVQSFLQTPLVFFTSGSTGSPKGIAKTLASLMAEVQVLEQCWGAQLEHAAVIGSVSHQHLYGFLFRSLWPLLTGRVSVAMQCSFPEQLLEHAAHWSRVAIVSSPALLKRAPALVDLSVLQQKLAAVFSSGGPLPAESALALQKTLQKPVTEILGSTETGGFAWREQDGSAASALWQLLPGMRVEAVDDHLLLHSPYLQQPQPLDDSGVIQADGRLHLLGRRDRVVKIEEKRVSLDEIEKQLQRSSLVTQARALVLHGARDGMAAVLVLSAEGEARHARDGKLALVAILRSELAQYFEPLLLPRKWRFVRELPQNDMGKTQAQALRALFAAEAEPVLLPEILARQCADNIAVLTLQIPPSLYYLQGHFPQQPVVPGVVQLHWAEHYLRECLACQLPVRDLEVVKFQQLLLPQQQCQLHLRWDAEKHKAYFEYRQDEQVFSSGRLVLEPTA